MKTISTVGLIVLAGVFAAMTVCAPSLLGNNEFLLEFVNHEFLNVLIVIVTVSFVSVTQIHLEFSRVERNFRIRAFGEARREVNIGAIILIVLLLVSIPLVIVKSELTESVRAQSALHGTAIIILITSIFIMYDFVRTVYVLASGEPIGDSHDDSTDDL